VLVLVVDTHVIVAVTGHSVSVIGHSVSVTGYSVSVIGHSVTGHSVSVIGHSVSVHVFVAMLPFVRSSIVVVSVNVYCQFEIVFAEASYFDSVQDAAAI